MDTNLSSYSRMKKTKRIHNPIGFYNINTD